MLKLNHSTLEFAFHDGHQQRKVDPLAVLSALSKCPAYRPAMVDSASQGSSEAVQVVSEVVRYAFDVQFINADGKGLTRLQCVQLMSRFDTWIRSVNQHNTASEPVK
tara:strand:- start:604 stop:924 length:321 start_codon:yes stop_codon:yes gene_type:complete